MTMTPDQRAEILDGYNLQLEEAAHELLHAMLSLSDLGDKAHIAALDTLPPIADGEAMPKVEEQVQLWNLLVRVRQELDRAQGAWRKVDTAAMHVSVVRQLPYYQAGPKLAGTVSL